MFSETKREKAIALTETAASIEKMRSGLRVVLIVSALGLATTPFVLLHAPHDISQLLLWVVLWVTMILVGLVGFSRFSSGAMGLARIEPEFMTASVLVRVGYVGGLVLLLVGLLLFLLIVGALLGIFLILIAAVLVLLGFVGLAMLCFKMRDTYEEPLYGTSGGLLLLSIVLGIVLTPFLRGLGSAVSGAVSLAALAVLYAAMGRTIRSLRERSARARVSPQST